MSNNVSLPHDHDVESKKVMERMPAEENFQTVAALMKQLNDPSRLRIFWILCHVEECVIDIAAMAGMSSPQSESKRSHRLPPRRKRNVLQSSRYRHCAKAASCSRRDYGNLLSDKIRVE